MRARGRLLHSSRASPARFGCRRPRGSRQHPASLRRPPPVFRLAKSSAISWRTRHSGWTWLAETITSSPPMLTRFAAAGAQLLANERGERGAGPSVLRQHHVGAGEGADPALHQFRIAFDAVRAGKPHDGLGEREGVHRPMIDLAQKPVLAGLEFPGPPPVGHVLLRAEVIDEAALFVGDGARGKLVPELRAVFPIVQESR